MLMRWKRKKPAAEAVNNAPAAPVIDEEEIKRKAIEEYLASKGEKSDDKID